MSEKTIDKEFALGELNRAHELITKDRAKADRDCAKALQNGETEDAKAYAAKASGLESGAGWLMYVYQNIQRNTP